jgi:hypothetical protein
MKGTQEDKPSYIVQAYENAVCNLLLNIKTYQYVKYVLKITVSIIYLV